MGDTNLAVPKQASSSTPLSSEINSMSDYQLKKLTRSNTRKNVGAKKNRFLSQLERVCRRLELLNVAPPVQPDAQDQSLQAIPIVNPDGSTSSSAMDNHEPLPRINPGEHQREEQEQPHPDDARMPRRAQTPRFPKDTPFALSIETQNSENSVSPAASTDDDFGIEPATVGSTQAETPSTMLTAKSFRSVRISTEVTILGYSPQNKKGEPMSLSVSTMRRTEHPTRNDKCFHLRPRRMNGNSFPRALNALERAKRIREIEGLSHDDANCKPDSALGTCDCEANSDGEPAAGGPKRVLLRYAKGSPRRPQSAAGRRNGQGAGEPSNTEGGKK
ncbi:hypothetical protein FGB62_248g022 [Gracilaria domingensis]|nr:hypothetical protein FGB62_248g022 [Gracilaria domingensis]